MRQRAPQGDKPIISVMSKSTERIVHMVGKVKNGVARPRCHRGSAEDVICDDPDRVTCGACLAMADADERWYRNQEDHYGETL